MANSKTIRAADGGYLLDAEQFKYTKDELGRPVLTVHGAALGGGDFMASGAVAMEGNLQMSGNAILGVKSISNTDSGMAIESEVDLNNHRITGLLEPVEPQDAVTKEYSDGKTNALQASAILKSGGKMIGKLKITATPTDADDVVDKEYVDAILPAYSAADNGKVLGVVDGQLAWVAKA